MFFTEKVITHKVEEIIDITEKINSIISKSKIDSGMCLIVVPHTSAGLTVNENFDPDVKSDILYGLKNLHFDDLGFSHSEGNSPAHIKSMLTGTTETLIIKDGKLMLGKWQGILLCEYDGPRTRTVNIKIIGG
ncbi:MAG: YjbQ family protein [Candidatus Delongbacteria bacterium]|nr:YjbQ family protein [Candidatus Delongbacteria bacterium]MBN2835193.1 YjbQ family protein [Candidatus Delongbacteria bacterium]